MAGPDPDTRPARALSRGSSSGTGRGRNEQFFSPRASSLGPFTTEATSAKQWVETHSSLIATFERHASR